jgi:hypothetical protein
MTVRGLLLWVFPRNVPDLPNTAGARASETDRHPGRTHCRSLAGVTWTRATAGRRTGANRPLQLVWRGLGALILMATAGCRTSPSVTLDLSRAHIERAVEHAHQSRTFRTRGHIDSPGPVLAWQGVVAGLDEQATIVTGGLRLENRRIGGRVWGRLVDAPGPWIEAPYDGPLALDVLLQGTPARSDHRGEQWSITLRFTDTDVLQALTHVPSTGATIADVTVHRDAITDVTLHLEGHASARMDLWDYGAPITVMPLDRTQPP